MDTLVLEGKNGRRVALTSVHLIGIDKDITSSIKEKVGNKIDLAPKDIIICATHTHSGPAIINLFGAGDQTRKENQNYIKNKLIPSITENIIEAYNNLENCEIGFSEINIPNITYNRRERKMYGPNLSLIKIKTQGKDYALINFACHPVTHLRDNKISRDYPGQVMNLLKEKEVETIWTTGCCGDINPLESILSYKNINSEDIIKMSETIGHRIKNELRNISTGTFDISSESSSLELLLDKEYGKKVLINMESSIQNTNFEKFVRLARERFEEEYNLNIFSEVSGFKIGGKILLGFPAEVCNITNKKMRDINREVITISLANDVVGYIADKTAFEKGFYEAGRVQFSYQRCPFKSDAESRLIKSSVQILDKLYK